MKKTTMALFVAALGAGGLAPTIPAAAQNAPGAANDDATGGRQTLDQITVTSSKRTQFLLDVPYAVTPISAQEIQDRGVRDLRDMQSIVPSLYITSNSPGMTRIQLRGLSSSQGLPTVGVNLDEVTLDQGYAQRTIDIPLVDLERIEVLRGPQGTLYGASSLGGTIRYITANPRLDAMSVTTEGGVSHVAGAKNQGYFTNVIANLPLSDGVAGLRIVAGAEDVPGWIDNRANGKPDINDTRREFLRLKGLVRLGPNVDATLMVYSSQLKADAVSLSDSGRQVVQRVDTPVNDRTGIANLIVNANLGAVSLVSSTAYLYRGLDSTADVSALIPVPGGVGYRQDESSKSYSQEVRLNSNSVGRLSWTSGLFYRHIETYVITTIPQINNRSVATQPFNSEQYAVFGEATYELVKNLSATAGLRYYKDHEALRRYSNPEAGQAQDFHATSPRVALLWRYDESGSLYANAAKGFRSGGFNGFADTPRAYGPERLYTYEVGNKAALAGGRLSYDVAVYYNQYRDIQGYLIAPLPLPHLIIQNTGRASGAGVDAALSAKITKQLGLDLTYGYNNMKYKVTNLDRNEGDPLNFIPKHTAGAALSYRYQWPVIGLPGLTRVDYQYASSYKVIARNTTPPVYNGDAVKTLNLRVGIETKRWQAFIEGRNLTNNYPITSPALGAQAENARPVPRSIGVSARAEF